MTHSIKLAASIALAAVLAPSGRAQNVADTSPKGMVAFFMTDTEGCPTGWRAGDLARGRVLVGASPTSVGAIVGEPLHDREVPKHRHGLQLKFELKSKSIAAFAGHNEQGADAGTKKFDVDTELAESNWGFVQLVACEKE